MPKDEKAKKTGGLFGVPKQKIKKQFQQAISRDKLLLEPVDRIPTEEVLRN